MSTAAVLPSEFKMSIATGMLESLGLNMYTSIGKSLAEFVANSYDADAGTVKISLPFIEIDDARKKLRLEAKKEVASRKREKFTSLYDPLPDQIKIVVEDDGHGMHASEIEKTFLFISRNRRKFNVKTESGQRYAMGRKGLGKLAGFGTAEKVAVWTKRRGDTFASEFTMDYNEITKDANISSVKFQSIYSHGLETETQGTRVTLYGLRCDSLKSSEAAVRQALAANFGVLGDDFRLTVNDVEVQEAQADWEYIYPEFGRDAEGFSNHKVVVDEDATFDIRYFVRFRAREGDSGEIAVDITKNGEIPKKTGSLSAGLRGARIYCNGRLAAGPTLLRLETGMHNFHSQSYMECVVHADEIDRQSVDYISTNRADLKSDNSTIDKLFDDVTELMRKALYEHSKFRKEKAVNQVEQDDLSKVYLKRVDGLSSAVKKSAKKILGTLAEVHGVKSATYRELAPIVLDGMNAGEVLTRLIELESNPKSISVLSSELLELAKIENGDAMKLYRGRTSGIIALEKLVKEATEKWKSGERFEKWLTTITMAG